MATSITTSPDSVSAAVVPPTALTRRALIRLPSMDVNDARRGIDVAQLSDTSSAARPQIVHWDMDVFSTCLVVVFAGFGGSLPIEITGGLPVNVVSQSNGPQTRALRSISSPNATLSMWGGTPFAQKLETRLLAEEKRLGPTLPSLSKLVSARAQTDAKIFELAVPEHLQRDALAFSKQAAEEGVTLPPPRLADGEVMFYWRKGRSYVDVGIHGNGTYSFFCRDSDGNEAESDEDIQISDGLPDQLKRALHGFG